MSACIFLCMIFNAAQTMSSACAASIDAPPSFTVIDLGKLGFAQVDGAPNTVDLYVKRPGVIVFVISDSVPATTGNYTLNVHLPATSSKIGDCINVTASLPLDYTLQTGYSNAIRYVFQDSTGQTKTETQTNSLIYTSSTFYYLGSGAWSGLEAAGW